MFQWGLGHSKFDEMTHHFHHVPGRMRVKSQLLKGNESGARHVREHLGRVGGVIAVEASTVTGSVVVRYDAAVVKGEVLLEQLHRLGVAAHPTLQHYEQVAQPGHMPHHRFSDRAVEHVASRVVETLIERSAVALIGALT
jgi:copper chaperone CopZ